jgi:hypothetical protein
MDSWVIICQFIGNIMNEIRQICFLNFKNYLINFYCKKYGTLFS